MRTFIFLLVSILMLPTGALPQTGQQIIDDPAPFAIELPELNTGLLQASVHKVIEVKPGQTITRIKLWVLPPFAERVRYQINAQLNDQSLSSISQKKRGAEGYFLDIDLRQNPNLVWKKDSNRLEVTAVDGRVTYRCSFIFLSGKSVKQLNNDLSEGCQKEIRTSTFPAPEDPNILQSDRVAPTLSVTAPQAAFRATSVAQSVVVSGSAVDDKGVIRTITVNSQLVASTPVVKDKFTVKLPPLKRGQKKPTPAPAPPPTLSFNTTILAPPELRTLMVEAIDDSGNRTQVTIPILHPDCTDDAITQKQNSLASTTTTGFSGRRYALIVGVSKYKFHEGGLHDLQFADEDARAFAEFLRTPSGGRFNQNDIVTLINENATKGSIQRAIEDFLDNPEENGVVYLFLAGHGAPDPLDPGSRLYFLLSTSKVTDMPGTALSMNELGEFVTRKSKKTRLIAFFDTCHSAGIKGQPSDFLAIAKTSTKGSAQDERGIGKKNKPASTGAKPPVAKPNSSPQQPAVITGSNFYDSKLFADKGWTVITSSGMNEESKEGPQWGDSRYSGHGVFTWALLNGLQGQADTNGDCKVTAGELADYIRKTVKEATGSEQNPQSLPGGNVSLIVATVACQKPARQ